MSTILLSDIGSAVRTAFLILSSQAPTFDAHHLWTQVGPAPADRFAAAVAGVGDLNADGRADVLVGVPYAIGPGPGGNPNTGRVQVLSGLDGALLLEHSGLSSNSRFGWSVDGAGDMNGDGVPDLIVGAPFGTPSAGSAFAFSGSTGALLTTWTGTAPGDQFGFAVCSPGDLDGDGLGDVAIGAPFADPNGMNSGRVEVFSGADGALILTLEGSAPWDQFGYALDGAGDVNTDGVPDLLIGAPFEDTSGFNAGSAFVYSGADGTLLLAFHGALAGDWLGSSVAAAGDINADGIPDLALGLPGSDLGGLDSGGAQVRSGADGGVLLLIAGGASGEYSFSVAGLGDADGDGFDDVLFGEPSSDRKAREAGRVRVISGKTGCDLLVREGLERNDWWGASLAGIGDANGDGKPDFAVGAPGHDDVLGKRGYASVLSAARLPAPPGIWLVGEPILLCE